MQVIQQLILDENNVAFYPMMGNSYQLNETSKQILEWMKQGKTKDEILDFLCQKYDVDSKEAFIDLSDFMAKLKVYGLLQ